MAIPNLPPNIQELSKKAEEIYSSLSEELKKQNNGKYIAIETDSKDHFIGETRENAVSQAHKKYPGKLIFVRRVGTIEKISSHSSQLFSNYGYARIF